MTATPHRDLEIVEKTAQRTHYSLAGQFRRRLQEHSQILLQRKIFCQTSCPLCSLSSHLLRSLVLPALQYKLRKNLSDPEAKGPVALDASQVHSVWRGHGVPVRLSAVSRAPRKECAVRGRTKQSERGAAGAEKGEKSALLGLLHRWIVPSYLRWRAEGGRLDVLLMSPLMPKNHPVLFEEGSGRDFVQAMMARRLR